MEVYTKLFLANLVAIIAIATIDRVVLKDALEKTKTGAILLGLWAWTGILSIPAWVIYQILAW